MKNKKILFRASGVGSLMGGGNEISEKQLEQIAELVARKNGTLLNKAGKPLGFSDTQKAALVDLEDKRDAPFQFGETAKKFIQQKWLFDMFGYREDVVTDVLMKGNLCEQDSIGLVSDVMPDEGVFRAKNTMHYTNQYFSGTPDVLVDKVKERIVEDVKTAWNLKTFFEKNDVPELYFAQLQAYMDLTKCKKARLHYCLVRTPESIIRGQCKRYFFKFGQDEESEDYINACEQVRINNELSYKDGTPIEQKDRLRTFEIAYDKEYVDKLKERVVLARVYYNSLSLNMIPKK